MVVALVPLGAFVILGDLGTFGALVALAPLGAFVILGVLGTFGALFTLDNLL